MCSGRGDEPLRPSGFPIRKSPDQSLVADSPGLIAGSYVLHRLLVPRHPPCSSQGTGGPGRVTPPTGALQPVQTEGALRPFPQDPTACSASGPLATAFRPRRGGRTDGRELTRGPNNQCSTSELATPGTDARAAALDETPKGLARCSLERR